MDNPNELATAICVGDRRALARAITLVESTRSDHRIEAAVLLEAVVATTGRSIRVGISGAPGAGKSTFIEALGLYLIAQGLCVAVLAVDPSSTRTGGSILGDKTRMEELSRSPQAFIRPSPSGGTLGGVARRTREALLLCEAGGFDVVLVETVGVGQSEVAVAVMVDTFVLLLAPASGDELQGVKRGIVEIADVIVVNKNDGDLAPSASRTTADYSNAAHFLRPRTDAWTTAVLSCSALHQRGIDDVWTAVLAHREALMCGAQFDRLRADQASDWMWSEVSDGLMASIREDPSVRGIADALNLAVRAGTASPTSAALEVLKVLKARPS